MLEFKRSLDQGHEAVSAVCKTAKTLKQLNDRHPNDQAGLRNLINELDVQTAAMLSGWHELHAETRLKLDEDKVTPEAVLDVLMFDTYCIKIIGVRDSSAPLGVKIKTEREELSAKKDKKESAAD
jgi:hypothetical protein